MFEVSAGALILLGAGVGLIAGILITMLQIRRHPGSWRLMQRQPTVRIPGWRSSLIVIGLGICVLILGAAQDQNAGILAVGAALLAFGAIRYVFRYYRPAV
jgi:hypothetical protein